MEIRKYMEKDISAMVYIWNKVVEDGESLVSILSSSSAVSFR